MTAVLIICGILVIFGLLLWMLVRILAPGSQQAGPGGPRTTQNARSPVLDRS